MIRIATADDQVGIVQLIDQVYEEYGEKMCLERADRDLVGLQEHYFDRSGCFWVLELEGQIRGTHSGAPVDDNADICVFKRLYLDQPLRGMHWGHELMQVAIDWARNAGFRKIEFWSDLRFERAHKFFAKFGFQRDGRIREMLDGHEPYREHFFSLSLDVDPDDPN